MILSKHKKIITTGCSFTKGYGLLNCLTDSWPSLLAKKFNLECINLAEPGAGNEYISNIALEYALLNDCSDCFFIIAYSDFIRLDFVYNENEVVHLVPNGRKHIKLRDCIYPYYANQKYLFKKFLFQVLKTQTWLESNNISYIMVNSIIEINPLILEKLDPQNIHKKINFDQYINFDSCNFNSIIHPDGKLLDGHPNELGHQRIADTIYNWIIK
jgi:lysophospholipase L1-like esterase